MRIFKAGLSSSYDVMARQNKKEKAPNVSDLNQNVETSYNSKLKFTQRKDLFIKREKLVKDELYA